MCTQCGRKWSKDNCGDHYKTTTPSTNKVIAGLRMIDSKTNVPMWEEAHVYNQGDQIQHERKTYSATAKTKQRPGDQKARNNAWKRIYDDHVRGEIYTKGQEVKFKGHLHLPNQQQRRGTRGLEVSLDLFWIEQYVRS